jgi:hypothetical protein
MVFLFRDEHYFQKASDGVLSSFQLRLMWGLISVFRLTMAMSQWKLGDAQFLHERGEY